MMMPENGHRAHGFSSAFFLDSDEIIQELNLNGNETIMDAGCGDGHNAIKILEDYNHKGTVYAVDVYDASIEDMEKYKSENNVENLINIEADITEGIPGVDDGSVDVVLMVNVFHGFKASRKLDEENLMRQSLNFQESSKMMEKLQSWTIRLGMFQKGLQHQ